MPEFPPFEIFTSALTSRFSHSRCFQNGYFPSPPRLMHPSFTVQASGFSLAFQPSRVLPSNMEIHPSLSAAQSAAAAIINNANVLMAHIVTLLGAKHARMVSNPREARRADARDRPRSDPDRG